MKLTQPEKGVICDIALEAYQAWPDRDTYERGLTSGLDAFTAWRHAEQFKAVGLNSLTLCTDEHYRDLQLHFIRLRSEHHAASQNLSLNL